MPVRPGIRCGIGSVRRPARVGTPGSIGRASNRGDPQAETVRAPPGARRGWPRAPAPRGVGRIARRRAASAPAECRAAQGRRQQPQHAVGQFVFDVVRSGGQQPPMLARSVRASTWKVDECVGRQHRQADPTGPTQLHGRADVPAVGMGEPLFFVGWADVADRSVEVHRATGCLPPESARPDQHEPRFRRSLDRRPVRIRRSATPGPDGEVRRSVAITAVASTRRPSRGTDIFRQRTQESSRLGGLR